MPRDKTGGGKAPVQRVIGTVGALATAIGIFVMSSIPGSGYPGHPDYLNTIAHFMEYLALSCFLTLALLSRRRRLWLTALLALALASLYGASDEVHQLFVAGRNADPVDWLVDTAGALVGVAATVWLVSARQVKRSRENDRLV